MVLNGARLEVRDFLEQAVDGVTLVPSEVNVGFAGACNLGRRAARGTFLALLNDDTEIEEGWLEQLVATAEAHPGVGAVGSAVLFPDGRVQEAGSIDWNDGSTIPVGRGAATLAPEHDFVRDVDYCSACSLLVRTSTWDAVGGMDEESPCVLRRLRPLHENQAVGSTHSLHAPFASPPSRRVEL